MPVGMIMQANKRKFERNAERFMRQFHVRLDYFFDSVLGFDFLKFSQFVGCPEEGNLHTHIYQIYGSVANYIIKDLS